MTVEDPDVEGRRLRPHLRQRAGPNILEPGKGERTPGAIREIQAVQHVADSGPLVDEQVEEALLNWQATAQDVRLHVALGHRSVDGVGDEGVDIVLCVS